MSEILCKECGHSIDAHRRETTFDVKGCQVMIDTTTGAYCDCDLIPSEIAAVEIVSLKAEITLREQATRTARDECAAKDEALIIADELCLAADALADWTRDKDNGLVIEVMRTRKVYLDMRNAKVPA